MSSTREDDFFQGSREAKLDRLGVKVNGFYQGATRAIPLPIFDETQWDHYLYHKGRDQVKNQQERKASDVGMHVLQKSGVTGKRLSNSPVCGKICIDSLMSHMWTDVRSLRSGRCAHRHIRHKVRT
jgi:hypothetical protein